MTDTGDTMPEGASSETSQSEGSNERLSAKIVMIGDSGVGKTSLVQRFSKGAIAWLDNGLIGSTIGVDFASKEVVVDNYRVKLQIWDTAGQERFQSMITSYFRNAVGVVAVYDVTNRKSFQNIEYWLKRVESVNTEPVIIIVGNKIDGERKITRSEGLQYSKQKGALFMETSVLIGHGITHIFEKLIRKVLQNEKAFSQLKSDSMSVDTYRGGTFGGCLCS